MDPFIMVKGDGKNIGDEAGSGEDDVCVNTTALIPLSLAQYVLRLDDDLYAYMPGWQRI
jgi:hypothetical protein